MSNMIYTPPGIYVDENASPVPNLGSVVALPPARVAIVGPSIGYRTATETIVLGSDPVALANTGVDTLNVSVKSLTGLAYEGLGVDYTLAEASPADETAVTTIAREAAGLIGAEDVVYVTYRYADADFFRPFYSTDWDEIQTRYGAAVDPSGAITSPLSLAAKICFEQRARELVLVPTKGSTATSASTAQLKSAYALLNTRQDIGMVVPLPVGIVGTTAAPGDTTNVATDLEDYVSGALSEGTQQIGILGYETTVDRDFDDVAAAVSSSRVVLAYPNAMNWYNGYTNMVTEISGYYLAAAYAGIMASQSPQVPLTAKGVRSFNNIPARIQAKMTRTFKNNLSGSGVAVTEVRPDGRLAVRHGVSTDMTSVLTREVSITRSKDALLRMVDRSLEFSGIIGDYATTESAVQIRGIVESALVQAATTKVIVGYSNLVVKSAAEDPTIFNVKFAYEPAYPVNKITVAFSINTQTGAVQEG